MNDPQSDLYRSLAVALTSAGVSAEHLDEAHEAARAHVYADPDGGLSFTDVPGTPGGLYGSAHGDSSAFVSSFFKGARPDLFAPKPSPDTLAPAPMSPMEAVARRLGGPATVVPRLPAQGTLSRAMIDARAGDASALDRYASKRAAGR